MEQAGFSRYQYDPFSRQLAPVAATPQRSTAHNQLWISDLVFVQERYNNAPRVKVGRLTL